MLLTHSTHSLTPVHGFGFPSIQDVPTLSQLDLIIEDRFQKFLSNYKSKITQKATQYVDTMDAIQRVQYSRKRTPYWFVTINPKPDVTIEQLHNAIVDLLSREEIENPTWCYEIRKSPSQGLHAHLLFTNHTADRNYADRKVKALFVPELCGTRKHVHIKWIPHSELEATRSYIIKKFTTKSKSKADTATKSWRLKNNIPVNLNEDHLLVWSELPKPTQE